MTVIPFKSLCSTFFGVKQCPLPSPETSTQIVHARTHTHTAHMTHTQQIRKSFVFIFCFRDNWHPATHLKKKFAPLPLVRSLHTDQAKKKEIKKNKKFIFYVFSQKKKKRNLIIWPIYGQPAKPFPKDGARMPFLLRTPNLNRS